MVTVGDLSLVLACGMMLGWCWLRLLVGCLWWLAVGLFAGMFVVVWYMLLLVRVCVFCCC